MIKAVASNTEEPLVILGLSDMNMEKLKEGRPIIVEMEELGLTGKILIIGGGTEDELVEMIRGKVPIENEIDKRNPST